MSDGEGLAVIGDPRDVERFLIAQGLASTDLTMPLGSLLTAGVGAAQVGSEIAATSGRWVKLTDESAAAIEKYGLRESSKTGLKTGVIRGEKGRVKGFVEFVKKPETLLTNPAFLSGAAGIMAQMAMQQTMGEIVDYLARIDQKVDDVLRAQKDAVLARMIGVGLVIDETMTIRENRGRVDEVTWSKVQAAPSTIAETQAYALRQLESLADAMERKSTIGALARAVSETDSEAQQWIAVLARCFHLQEAIAVLELDRVLDASPHELDAHRRGLRAARHDRLDLISKSTRHLLDRIDTAAGRANTRVLLHPTKSPEVVQSGNHLAGFVSDFHRLLGIASEQDSVQARRWSEAAAELGGKALIVGADGVDATRRLGNRATARARSVAGEVSDRVSSGVGRWRSGSRSADDESLSGPP